MGLFSNPETEGLREDIRTLNASVSALVGKKDALREEIGLSENVIQLKKRVAELEIEKSKREEDFARRERELTHMIGLEKKRQEFEVDAATKSAKLAVREENLDADKRRFEETIRDNKKSLEDGFGYMRGILTEVLGRLPTVTVDKRAK